jgi:hypothetical protein
LGIESFFFIYYSIFRMLVMGKKILGMVGWLAGWMVAASSEIAIPSSSHQLTHAIGSRPTDMHLQVLRIIYPQQRS